jgi:hypothetical protein
MAIGAVIGDMAIIDNRSTVGRISEVARALDNAHAQAHARATPCGSSRRDAVPLHNPADMPPISIDSVTGLRTDLGPEAMSSKPSLSFSREQIQ